MASVIIAKLPSPPLMVVNGAQPFSGTLRRIAVSPIREKKDCRSRVAKATGESSETSIVKSLQNVWDKSEDRVALIGLGFAGVVVFWASVNLIGAIDKLPVIPGLLELIGILFSSLHSTVVHIPISLVQARQGRTFWKDQQVDIGYLRAMRVVDDDCFPTILDDV